MSYVSRRASAPLPASTVPASERPSDPIAAAEADLALSVEAAREAGRRVSGLRAGLDHAEAHPLDYPDGKAYAAALDELRHALAVAAAQANRANAEREARASALEDLRRARDEAEKVPLRDAADAALAALAGGATAAGAGQLAHLRAEAIKAVAARDTNRDTLRAAGQHPDHDARTSLASSWASLLDPRPGAVGVLTTAANVARWVEQAPEREAENREFERRRRLARERDDREAALRGERGEEARAAAQEARRKGVAEFYATGGKSALAAGAAGTAAELPLALARAEVS